MVQPETARWLNESRGSFGAAQSRFNDISSMDVTGAGALFMSAEYAVKAVIVEHYGCLPPSFETHRIVNLSHRIGLWSQFHPTCGRTCRHCAPRPPRPLPGRDRVRDLGPVVIERGVAAAPDDRATVHPVHRARRDPEPRRLRQANLLTSAPLSPHGDEEAILAGRSGCSQSSPVSTARPAALHLATVECSVPLDSTHRHAPRARHHHRSRPSLASGLGLCGVGGPGPGWRSPRYVGRSPS